MNSQLALLLGILVLALAASQVMDASSDTKENFGWHGWYGWRWPWWRRRWWYPHWNRRWWHYGYPYAYRSSYYPYSGYRW